MQRAQAKNMEIIIVLVDILPLWVLKTMVSYIGQQFTITKPANNICKYRHSRFFCLKISTMPHRNETKFIMAAVVSGKNKGDETPNSKIPCLYRLLCSLSTTLLVTLNPNWEMPMDLSKYSTKENAKLEDPTIIHTPWLLHYLWIVPPDNKKSRQSCVHAPRKRNMYKKNLGSETYKLNHI